MTSGVRPKDVKKLLSLFRQMEKLLRPNLPAKKRELWDQSLKQAKEELVQQLKKKESSLSPARGRIILPQKLGETKQKEIQQQFEKCVLEIAEQRYREKDEEYSEAVNTARKAVEQVVRKIDHTLYSIGKSLSEFDRAQGTLLQANWRQIRDIFSVDEIMQFQAHGLVERAIDALEAIKRKVKQQRPKVSQRISAWLWKLYEKTLKVIVDEFLERMCSK